MNLYQFIERIKILFGSKTTNSNVSLDTIITDNIPHIGEQVLEKMPTDSLIQYQKVSPTWRALARKVLVQRYKNNLIQVFEQENEIIFEAFKILLEDSKNLEIDFNAKGNSGMTVFMLACQLGLKEVVKLFLDYSQSKNIDLNAKNSDGWTAFFFACYSGGPEIVKLLLDHSASKNIDFNSKSSGDEFTGFILACGFGTQEHKKVVKLILDYSIKNCIDLNAKMANGNTAFITACELGHTDVVKLLLDHSASKNIDFNATNNHGHTGFRRALELKETKVVKLLRKYSKAKNINVSPS